MNNNKYKNELTPLLITISPILLSEVVIVEHLI